MRGWPAPTPAVLGPTPLQRAAGTLARMLRWAAASAPELLWDVRSLAERLAAVALRERLFAHVFPWALERAKARYGRPGRSTAIAGPADSCDCGRRLGGDRSAPLVWLGSSTNVAGEQPEPLAPPPARA